MMCFKFYELMEIISDVMDKLESMDVTPEQYAGVQISFMERECDGEYSRYRVGVMVPKRDGSGKHRREPACH